MHEILLSLCTTNKYMTTDVFSDLFSHSVYELLQSLLFSLQERVSSLNCLLQLHQGLGLLTQEEESNKRLKLT